MKSLNLFLLAGLSLGMTVRAETTPLDEALPEAKETTITCELTRAPHTGEVPVLNSAKACEAAKGTYHYKLWLPKGYGADPQRRWPCMFIADPHGNARMGGMGQWLKSHDYVVVMLVESQNGPWEPIVGNFLAAHDDVVRRVRIQEGLKFATGFSGGSRAASIFVSSRPGFSGLILQSSGGFQEHGGFNLTGVKRNQNLYVAMTFGVKDTTCKGEDRIVKSALAGPRFLLIHFDGGHDWAPQDKFEKAIGWVERQIYIEGPPNPLLATAYLRRFQSEAARVAELSAPWERYKLADSLIAFSQSRNLAGKAEIAATLRDLRLEVSKLRSDPGIAREAQAAEALHRVEQSRDRTPPTMFVANCRNLARQFVGTEAATEAEALAAAALNPEQ